MKQFVFACLALTLLCYTATAQVKSSKRFNPTGSNVIAYKQGTSCTASAYSFYMISDAGVQAGSPFYTLANINKEVNGIGINAIDQYMYGVQYDRDAACAFTNFHLKRYDAAGGEEDLGTLPAPANGSVSGALGCVTLDGKFIYSTRDAAGNSYVSMISNIAALPANAGATLTLTTSKLLTNNAGAYSFSDWAIHPTNGKIYSYGIINNGGISTGSVLKIDPLTGIISTVGTADVTSFLDAARDNFGGLYFGSDLMLYGININTRKLYKTDVLTGTTQYKTTISGSGQIRADMGSFVSGYVALPINFEKMVLVQKSEGDFLAWKVIVNHTVKEFVVERSIDGHTYTAIQHMVLTAEDKSRVDFTYHLPAIGGVYRIKAVGAMDDINYSAMIKYTPHTPATLTLAGNPVTDGVLRFIPAAAGSYGYSVLDASGHSVISGKMICATTSMSSIMLPTLQKGIYFLRLAGEQVTMVKFVVE